jgi:hypothetical protein
MHVLWPLWFFFICIAGGLAVWYGITPEGSTAQRLTWRCAWLALLCSVVVLMAGII